MILVGGVLSAILQDFYCTAVNGGKYAFWGCMGFFWPQYLKRPLDKDRTSVRVLTHLSSSLSPSSQESDYFTPQGEFRVDKAGSPTLLNCLMYKMSYYRFGEMQVRPRWTRPVKRSKVVSRWFFPANPLIFNNAISLPSWTSGRRRASTGRATPRSATRT